MDELGCGGFVMIQWNFGETVNDLAQHAQVCFLTASLVLVN